MFPLFAIKLILPVPALNKSEKNRPDNKPSLLPENIYLSEITGLISSEMPNKERFFINSLLLYLAGIDDNLLRFPVFQNLNCYFHDPDII
jgi:hypothetical protein